MTATATLAQIRQWVSPRLSGQGQGGGGYLSSTATGGSSTTLVDTSWPAKTTLPVDESWQDVWILRPNAGALDRVRLVQTYTPTTGTFLVDNAYSVTPTNTEPYELHTIIEPQVALTSLINQALKRCLIEVELTATPVALSTEHSLATIAPWLESGRWLRQVGYLNAAENRNVVDPFQRVVRGELRADHGAVVLNHPGQTFLATDVLYLKAMKPAYDDCKPAAGTFGSQAGLVLDTDVAPVPVEWAGTGAIVEVWDRYGKMIETGARARLLPDRAEAAINFSRQTRMNSHWPALTFRPLLYGGPRVSTGLRSAYRATGYRWASSLHMSPALAQDNVTYHRLRHAELSGNRPLMDAISV